MKPILRIETEKFEHVASEDNDNGIEETKYKMKDIKLFELGGGELKGLLQGDFLELGRYNYGYQKVFGFALEHYGLRSLFTRLQDKISNALFN